MDRNPHNFLLFLRNRRPALARRFDGIRGLGRMGGVLTASADPASWCGRELIRLAPEVAEEATRFFGEGAGFAVEPAAPDAEGLPFPVRSTKAWNHVVFLRWRGGALRALALSKPCHAALRDEGELSREGVRVFADEGRLSGEEPLDALPRLMDWAAALAREASSYAQFVAAFPGDEEADRWEARLFAAKEWGTPATPAPLLARHLGRLHYADPDAPPRGLRLLDEISGP